ncbi:MAG: hypothetical protein WDK96_03050 [Candidatus Paceibacterota bacterium]
MKVYVLQSIEGNIKDIKFALFEKNPSLLEKIHFSSYYGEIEKLISLHPGEEIILITGQIFPCNQTGTKLDETLEMRNSKIKVYLYSTMPEYSQFLDGYIKKPSNLCNTKDYNSIVNFILKLNLINT